MEYTDILFETPLKYVFAVLISVQALSGIPPQETAVHKTVDEVEGQQSLLDDTVIEGPYFSPRGGAEEAIVRRIDESKNSLMIQAYSFTSGPIIRAVIKAKQRGVVVNAVLDKSHLSEKNGAAAQLKAAGVPVRIDSQHQIAHNKLMIIDTTYVVTGSYNFTNSAEMRNAENVLIIKNDLIVRAYVDNFVKHFDHSNQY